jgi:hypothetical protein
MLEWHYVYKNIIAFCAITTSVGLVVLVGIVVIALGSQRNHSTRVVFMCGVCWSRINVGIEVATWRCGFRTGN